MSDHPMGTATFLFTNIQDSISLWATLPKAMRHSLVCHDALVR